jgi:uncharacterized membrane protein HdeD (DUF308 family)
VVIGVLKIIAAIQLRREVANEWFLALGEAISVLFGLYVFANPVQGWVCACVWLMSLYALVSASRSWRVDSGCAGIGPSVPKRTPLDRG